MSSSLTKRKNQTQKENSNRLSNSKIISAYSGANLSKVNCSQFVHPLLTSNYDEKQKNSTKRAKLKTSRKHQMSVEFILSSKFKEPHSMRSLQIEKQKTKCKKRKKDKNSHQSSKFIISIGDFSKSNSLIVFSQKDSTINPNLQRQEQAFIFPSRKTPNKAAIIIQKNWRGYLTRKLLDQYINDEQSKLHSVIKKLRSKEDSFTVEQKNEDVNFSLLSSINWQTMNKVQLKKQIQQEDYYETNGKNYPMFATQQESSIHQPLKLENLLQCQRSFFKNHKTQPDIETHHKTSVNLMSSNSKKMPNFTINSSIFNYSFCNKFEQQSINSFLSNEELPAKIERIKSSIESELKVFKRQLKEKLQVHEISVEEMIERNNKLKDIFSNCSEFLRDVELEIKAILEDMADVVNNGICQDYAGQGNMQMEPKSELFTIELDDNEPELPKFKESQFSSGQLKLQSYLTELTEEYKQNYPQFSELEYLCQILKINSDQGVKSILERCLVQFTVEIITENYPIEQLNKVIHQTCFGQSKAEIFTKKWIDELNKWEMGPIQQVTQAMESSSFINGQVSRSLILQQL